MGCESVVRVIWKKYVQIIPIATKTYTESERLYTLRCIRRVAIFLSNARETWSWILSFLRSLLIWVECELCFLWLLWRSKYSKKAVETKTLQTNVRLFHEDRTRALIILSVKRTICCDPNNLQTIVLWYYHLQASVYRWLFYLFFFFFTFQTSGFGQTTTDQARHSRTKLLVATSKKEHCQLPLDRSCLAKPGRWNNRLKVKTVTLACNW